MYGFNTAALITNRLDRISQPTGRDRNTQKSKIIIHAQQAVHTPQVSGIRILACIEILSSRYLPTLAPGWLSLSSTLEVCRSGMVIRSSRRFCLLNLHHLLPPASAQRPHQSLTHSASQSVSQSVNHLGPLLGPRLSPRKAYLRHFFALRSSFVLLFVPQFASVVNFGPVPASLLSV